jgi:PAS domain S-box-containing protein
MADKTKEEFIEEINLLKSRIAELEISGPQRICVPGDVQDHAAELGAVIAAMAIGLVIYDLAGKAVFLNSFAKELFPPEFFFNMNAAERRQALRWETEAGQLFALEDLPVSRALKGETTYNVVLAAFLPTRKAWLSGSAAPIVSSEGKILGAVSTFVDVTDRKLAEEELCKSEGKFRDLFNNAEVGMFRSRLDGSELLDLNDKDLSILGWTREEIIGKPTVIFWADPKQREAMSKGLKENGHVDDFECRLLNKAGEVRNCLTSIRLYPQTGILEGSIIDITGRKQVEEALIIAKEEAEAANKYKTEFLTNISHDLRTPLNAILGFSHILKSAKMEEKYRKSVDFINERGKHLLAMVEAILDVSKMDSGRLALQSEEFDLRGLLGNSIEASRFSLGAKDVKMLLNIEGALPRLKGDALRVQQIIDNLLNNAVKYTLQGQILVTVRTDQQPSDQGRYRVEISVKDTGFGIPGDKLPYIFDSFTRFHEFYKGKTYDGLGLGLHIVKKMTALMGAEIRVSSQIDRGSEFIVTFNFDKV